MVGCFIDDDDLLVTGFVEDMWLDDVGKNSGYMQNKIYSFDIIQLKDFQCMEM